MTRKLILVTGTDSHSFLQGLITNNVSRADEGGIAYSALLTPQGKYLADFFVVKWQDGYLLDMTAFQADDMMRRLSMYKLRAKVDLAPADGLGVIRGIGNPPEGALADPRNEALGWRLYGADNPPEEPVDWDAIRVGNLIPEGGIEMGPDTYILEMGFDRLNGVDFRKGCFVGQEVTARMRHKTTLRKGLMQVTLAGPVPVGTTITRDERDIGEVHTVSGNQALAYLRFDRIGEGMEAGGVTVTAEQPDAG